MDRHALGHYLRSRRELLDPSGFGLDGAGRRTPGLRRSEIADLAAVSVVHYTNIEQGRGSRPSAEVLNAIARAMGLSRSETEHVFALAGELAPRPSSPDDALSERMRLLLQGVGPLAALVCSARFDVLGQNAAAASILGDLMAGLENRRNLARRHFLPGPEDEARPALDHEVFSRFAAAGLRNALARYPDDPGTRELVAELLAHSQRFQHIWSRGPVGLLDGDELDRARVFIDNETMRCDVTMIPDRDQYLIFLTPEA